MIETPVLKLSDIAEPGALEFRVGDDDDWPFRGMVVRWQGQVYAYANVCPHVGLPLNLDPDGFFDPARKRLICSSHGALFEPTAVVVSAVPVKARSCVRSTAALRVIRYL